MYLAITKAVSSVLRTFVVRHASQMRVVEIYFFTVLDFWKMLFVLYLDLSTAKFVLHVHVVFNLDFIWKPRWSGGRVV